MKKLKKLTCILLTAVLMLSMGTFAFAESGITSVEIADVAVPVAGEKPDYTVARRTSGYTLNAGNNNPNYYKNGICWYDVTEGKNISVNDTFKEGHNYKVIIIAEADDGYVFSSNVSATVNGKSARVTDLGNDSVEITYEFLIVNDIYIVIDAPVTGVKQPYFAMVGASSYKLEGGNNPNYYQNGIGWYSVTDGKNLMVGNRFESEKQYKVILNVTATGNYIFAQNATARVGNNEASLTYIDERTVQVEYTFPKLPGNSFVDVKKSDYFYEPVLWALSAEITTGLDATHFGPDAGCTRAQAVTFLWRAAGCPAPLTSNNPFKDVKAKDYFYKAVLWAAECGITTGTAADKFSPNDICTRGQIVTFLWRAQGGTKVSAANPFKDVKKSDYYCNAVLWAVKNNVTTGTGKDTFSPADTCTRGQIVTFLYRAYNN